MPVDTWSGRRTTISVRLDDSDLAKLDALAEAGVGAPMQTYGWKKGTRGEAIRQLIRDAKVPKEGKK